jgi:hypothetical protein
MPIEEKVALLQTETNTLLKIQGYRLGRHSIYAGKRTI